MGDRLQLHTLLVSLLGNNRVYFQPPPKERMVYPAVVYARSTVETTYANNYPYTSRKVYQVTYISDDPDDSFPDKLGRLQSASFLRSFKAENLHHTVYQLYI